jgi:hypothetical protein
MIDGMALIQNETAEPQPIHRDRDGQRQARTH